MKRSFSGLAVLFFLLQLYIQVFSSCANIVPPAGGARDSLPPVLVYAAPKDSSLNFNTNKIVLSFDEYVQLDNQSMQTTLVISPTPDQQPYISSRLREVTVRLKDSLKPNTTYSINFGNSVKDVNENNPYRNFTYVFSTGSTIANGTLSGRVQLAETGKTDSTLIVLLHSNLSDSAVKKVRPEYYTRIDSGGRFTFRYIAHGTYNVFVLPNDFTKRYDDSTKMFAFLNAPVQVDSLSNDVLLYAYNEYVRTEEQSFGRGEQGGRKQPADTASFIKASVDVERGQQDLLTDLTISFPKPLQSFDSSKITLSDTNFNALQGYTITAADTTFRRFTLRYPWKENQHFKLVMQPGAFTDSSGRTLDGNDTLTFRTKPESDYGSVRLRFMNINLDNHPVLQLIQNNKVVDSVALGSREFFRKLYAPGEYEMRILYDEDANLSWTPGSYTLRKQPEIVIYTPRKLTVKSNWDNEVNINL